MAHVSLYRRFRPDTFEKMVRQEHVVRVLKNQILKHAVGHAYLFCGPRGTGKTSVARIFARAVNCEQPVNGSPCGKCPTCLALAAGSLDISEIDAASNNGVNEMRDLREKVQYPPVTGKYKVYIIDEVHMLTDSAFNALLKTLEEPPAHALFLLATTEPQKLPATILSRCMRLDFKLIPEEDLERHLKSILDEIGVPYEDEAVAAIARAGAGSDRDMLSIAEMCISYGDTLTYEGVIAVLGAADFKETGALVSALLSSDLSAALSATERLLAEGKAVGVLLRDLLELLNRVAVAKTCAAAEKLLALPKEIYREIAAIAERSDGRAILRATEILARTETELRYAASPRILLETAIMRIACPQNDDNIDALLVRISRLESRLSLLEAGAPQRPAQAEPLKQEPAPKPAQAEPSKREPVPKPAQAEPSKREPVPKPAQAEPSKREPVPKPAQAEISAETQKDDAPPWEEAQPTPAAPAPGAGEGLTAELAFGKFMRYLRKNVKNGVLFALCSDLEAKFEGDVLVLTSESENVVRALGREEHRRFMEEAFTQVGVGAFEVRLVSEKGSEADGLEELKRTFQDYPIEVK